MTVTATIKTRAWPAKVTINGEDHQISSQTTQDFHIEAGATIIVTQLEPEAASAVEEKIPLKSKTPTAPEAKTE